MTAAITAAVIGGAAVVGAAAISASSQPDTSSLNNAAATSDQEQAQIAQNEWNNFQTTFQPLEGKFVGEANNWTSPQNYDQAAGNAAATVDAQYGSAKAQLQRTPGMDPSSGAYQAGMTNLGISQAASSATAQNAARATTQNQGIGMQEAAMNVGINEPAQAASAAGSAGYGLSSLSNSVNNQNTATGTAIGGAVQSVANGVTSYVNSNPTSSGYNFNTGFSTPTSTSYGVTAPAGLSGVGYTVPSPDSYLSN